MINLIFGIATVAVCTLLCVFAYRLALRDRHRPALMLIVVCGLLLRLYTGTDLFLHDWDERYHALVAKNLIAHPLRPTLYENPVLPYDHRDWGGNHIWVHKQPVPLWSMALGMKLFGVNEIAMRLPSIVLSTLAIVLTFAIGAALFGRQAGLLAAFFHAINGQIIRVTTGRSSTDHIDLFHLFFVELAVYLVVLYVRDRRRSIAVLIGVTTGVAVMCKWLTALIVLPLWFILARTKAAPRRLVTGLLMIAAFCLATFLPWQLYIHAAFPLEAAQESAFNLRHIFEPLDGHEGSVFFHLFWLSHYGELIYIPLAWFLYRTYRQWRDERHLMLAVWFVVPLAFFTIVRTKMEAYTLFAAPAIFIMAAVFILTARDGLSQSRHRTALSALLVLLIAVPVFHAIKETKPFSMMERNPAWAAQLRELGRAIPDPKAVFFNTPRPIEAMFYTRGTAYKGLPTAEQRADLAGRGYRIYVLDTGNVPEDIRRDGKVTVIDPARPRGTDAATPP